VVSSGTYQLPRTMRWTEARLRPVAFASLRMDQAKTWEEFRDACAYSNIPGENMIWADKLGNIGWQSVGIAPIRTNWSGLVAVPGDGRFEWAGFLPIKEKPHSFNPPDGFIATANNDLIPRGYAHMNAVGFVWTDPFRWARISEVLGSGRKLAVPDMMRLQTDYLSIIARQLVFLLRDVSSQPASPDVDRARRALLAWDFVLSKESVPAGVRACWKLPAARYSTTASATLRSVRGTPEYRRSGPEPDAWIPARDPEISRSGRHR